MEMQESHAVTLITVRIALVCYAIVVGHLLTGRRRLDRRTLLRGLWTIGCVAFILHVLAAFHYTHHWSHRAAILSTAEQTQQLLGWAFGEGLYFSYLFLLLWTADVLWWWLRPEHYESRSIWLECGIHGYLFFIAFNGAVIFESGVTRSGGIAAAAIFVAILMCRRFLRW